MSSNSYIIEYAGVAAVDNSNRIVLIKRGDAPAKGLWSLPAGFVEKGETSEQAAIREVKEETCLDVSIEEKIGLYYGKDFRLFIYSGKIIGGSLQARDDAADAKLVKLDEIPLEQPEAQSVPCEEYWAVEMNIKVLQDTLTHYEFHY